MANQTFVTTAQPVSLSQARKLMDQALAIVGNRRSNYFENSTYRKGLRIARSQVWRDSMQESRDLSSKINNMLSTIAPNGSFRVSQSRKYPSFVISIFYTSRSK